MEGLVAERAANGPFTSLSDFATRADPQHVNKRLLENLVRAGAFDALHRNRAELFDSLETVVRHASLAASERQSDQVNMFAMDGEKQEVRIRLTERSEWPQMDKLKGVRRARLLFVRPSLGRVSGVAGSPAGRALGSDRLGHRSQGELTRLVLAGIVVGKQIRMSKSGNRFAFAQLTDRTGVFEITLFSEFLANAKDLLDAGEPLLIKADARMEDETVRLLAATVEPLDKAVERTAAGLEIHLRDGRALEPLKGLIENEGMGRGSISIVVASPQGDVKIALPQAYQCPVNCAVRLRPFPASTS